MQTSFTTHKLLFNIFCILFNDVKTATINESDNISDTCQNKPTASSNDGVFKLPWAVKNMPSKKTYQHKYFDNNCSNITESSDFQSNNIHNFTDFPLSIGNEFNINNIVSGDNISEHVPKFQENSITSLGTLIDSIYSREQTYNNKDHRIIDSLEVKNDIEVKKVADNNVLDFHGINISESIHPKTSESISHNTTKVLRNLNNQSGEINSQNHLCSNLYIDEYIEMISESHIYSTPPDFFHDEGRIKEFLFPLFDIESHNLEDHTFYPMKSSDFTFKRVTGAKNKSTQSKSICNSTSSTHKSTPVRHIQTNKSDYYNKKDYKQGENLLKKRKLISNETFVDVLSEGNDQQLITKRKRTAKTTKDSLDMFSNKSKNDVNVYDLSEDSGAARCNQWVTKSMLKKCTPRDNLHANIETNPHISSTDTIETNTKNNTFFTFSLNGQYIQHNFGLPGNSHLVLENIRGTLEKTKYVITVFRKYNKLNDTYRMNFYIPFTNLNKLKIETSANIKSIIFNVVTSKYKIQQNMHISLYALKNSDGAPHKVFIRKFPVHELDMLLTNLLDVKFPVYNFLNVGTNNIIHFEYHPPEKDMSSMNIRQFINDFQKIKHLLRIKSLSKPKQPSKILDALRHVPTCDPRRICTWFSVLSIIKDDCILFIESMKDIKEVLHNTSIKNNAHKVQMIKTILDYLISRLNHKLYCYKIEDTSHKAYLYETLVISFRMFLQTEIKGVFEYWIQHIAETDEILEIIPIFFKKNIHK